MVECTGLENQRALTGTGSSNLPSSAIVAKIMLELGNFIERDK